MQGCLFCLVGQMCFMQYRLEHGNLQAIGQWSHVKIQIVLIEKEGKPKGKSNFFRDLLNNIGEMG